MNSDTVQRPSLFSGKASTAHSGSIAANPSQYFWLSVSLSVMTMCARVLGRECEAGAAAARIVAIFERQRAAVTFGDLPAQHQPDAGAALLGGEERHEQVRGIRK